MKIRLRTLLILVAAAAVLLFADVKRRRWAEYRKLAAYHAMMEQDESHRALFYRAFTDPESREYTRAHRIQASQHATLKWEYLNRW